MDADLVKVIFGLCGVLFGWLFFRTNANHSKAEDVRKENTDKIESLRLEYVQKISDIYEENKEDRRQHNQDMMCMQKSIHEMAITIGDKIAAQIKELNVMPEHHVKEYVDNKLDPLIDGYHEIKKSNSEVVKQVALLIDRSK